MDLLSLGMKIDVLQSHARVDSCWILGLVLELISCVLFFVEDVERMGILFNVLFNLFKLSSLPSYFSRALSAT